MGGLLLAAALQAAWMPTQADPADSRAAAIIYIEACLQGKISLSPSRGRMLSDSEGISYRNSFAWWGNPKQLKIIKFSKPDNTMLFIADYGPSNKVERTCILKSKHLNIDDARNAFMIGTENLKPEQRNWNRYFTNWGLDLPKLGYRKDLSIKDDRTIELEFSTYAPTQQ